MSSSTFSSEKATPGPKEPLAILIGVLLLLALELVVRTVPESWRIGYTSALGAYYEVKHQVEAFGAADVGILGTSRGRESVVVPSLQAICAKELGDPLTVANYSCAGIRAREVEYLTKMLLRSRKKPRLLLYVVSPRILQGEENNERFEQLFASDADRRLIGGSKKKTLDEMISEPVLDVLWRTYKTFRHRMRFHSLLSTMARGQVPSSPVKGEYTMWQRYDSGRKLSRSGLTKEDVNRYVEGLMNGKGEYVLGAQRIKALEDTFVVCQRAGVPIVLIEVPLAQMLKEAYPRGLYDRFLNIMRTVCKNAGVPFVELDQLGISLTDEDFLEYSHLNLEGAQIFTKALAEKVAVPMLRRGALAKSSEWSGRR
jgi:hypothetical protein